MPYLVYLGTNPHNVAGTSSKGYWIHRRGGTVWTRWGPVDSSGGMGGRFAWRGVGQSWDRRFGSEADARRHVERKLREKLDSGYDLLPAWRKIEEG